MHDARQVLVAPDSFKGTFRAPEVAAAIGRGLEAAGMVPPDLCPVADGGEGTLEVLLTALGGETAGADVHDALGSPIRAGFALIEGGGTAIVETAAASGFLNQGDSPLDFSASQSRAPGQNPRRVHQEACPLDSWEASTYGTGELIVAAAAAGAEVVLVGVGGSATTDGGEGALRAIEDAGGLGDTRLVMLCDVRTPWERCASVFGPQKGADAAMVRRLAARLEAFGGGLPRDPRGVPMTGAAGGLAGGLWAVHGAVLESGANFVLDALDFNDRMRASRCVITGEGWLDEQTLQGKVVGEIGTRTRQGGVPLHAVVGSVGLDLFGQRMIDLQVVLEAPTLAAVEASAHRIGEQILADSG